MPELANSTSPIALLGGDRPLPNNLAAEKAVLGCILLDSATAIEPAMSVLSESRSFHDPRHQRIYAAMLELQKSNQGASIDLLTITDALDRSGALENAGGRDYLVELASSVATAANIEYFVDLVYQNAILRRLIATGVDIVQKCYEPRRSVRELVDQLEREVLEINVSHQAGAIVPVGAVVGEAFTHIERLRSGDLATTGLPTGYANLDRIIMGLRPTEMIVLAARPSIGKTAFALNIAEHIALGSQPAPVGIFSLEMGTKQLVLRLLSSLARLNLGAIQTTALPPARWKDICAAGTRLQTAPIYIDDSNSGLDVLEIRSRARRMKAEYDVGVIIIDYLQLINPTGGNRNSTRENDVAAISGGLKGLARELNIPIVVLAQLNRQAELGGKPKLAHLRESGAIEQDADIVMMLHRDRDVDNTAVDAQGAQPAEVIVAKNRNGQTGTANLLFIPSYTRFENPSRVDDRDVPM